MGTLLSDDGFRAALVVALVGAAIAWWLATRNRIEVPGPAVVVVAALVGLRVQQHVPLALFIGLVFLAFGAWAIRGAGAWILGGVALFAGATFLVVALPDAWPTWIAVVMFLTVLPLTPLAELRARRWDRLAPAALLLATLGAYVCVPDTEVLRPLAASLLVAAIAAFVPSLPSVQLGSGVVAALLVWSVAVDGIGRPGSVIGGLSCVGALALLPSYPATGRPAGMWWVRVGITVVLVIWCARVAGFVHSAWLAALLAAFGLAVALPVAVVAAGGARLRRRR